MLKSIWCIELGASKVLVYSGFSNQGKTLTQSKIYRWHRIRKRKIISDNLIHYDEVMHTLHSKNKSKTYINLYCGNGHREKIINISIKIIVMNKIFIQRILSRKIQVNRDIS